MKPRFKSIINKAPEIAFLNCKESLPDEATLAAEIAAEQKLEPDDVKVIYEDDETNVRRVPVFQRIFQEINCRNKFWIIEARKCLVERTEFDLLGATEANLTDLEIEGYTDTFHWSGQQQRRKFRLKPIGEP